MSEHMPDPLKEPRLYLEEHEDYAEDATEVKEGSRSEEEGQGEMIPTQYSGGEEDDPNVSKDALLGEQNTSQQNQQQSRFGIMKKKTVRFAEHKSSASRNNSQISK